MKGVTCCYAKSDKYWTIDPQGVAWQSSHTLDAAPVFGDRLGRGRENAKAACCSPSAE